MQEQPLKWRVPNETHAVRRLGRKLERTAPGPCGAVMKPDRVALRCSDLDDPTPSRGAGVDPAEAWRTGQDQSAGRPQTCGALARGAADRDYSSPRRAGRICPRISPPGLSSVCRLA